MPEHGPHHSHSHGSLRLATGSRRVARALAVGIGLTLVLTVVGLVVLRPTGPVTKAPGVIPGTVFVDGHVNAVIPDLCPEEYDATVECATAEVRVKGGPEAGEITEIPVTRGIPGAPDLRPGDDIRMSYFAKGPEGYRYQFDDFQRDRPLVLLGVLFVVAVVALSRMQGVRAIAGMAISLVVIVAYLLPALLRGGPPLPLALVTAVVVAACALYLAHGIHVGTHVAFAGSVLALVLTTVLGAVFIGLSHFTGMADENVLSLTVAAGELDFRGLILAGLVIGSLGVLDDMTVTQVSAVAELQAADPDRSAFDLYRAGLRIGRDHVASTVNTLVLAYAGASLPLLLLFSQGGRPITGVLATETVAVEVVGALVGSIGLVAAVPITTGLAAWVVHRPGATGGAEPEETASARTSLPWLAVPDLAFRAAATDDVDAIVRLVTDAYRGEASTAGWTTEEALLKGQRTDPVMVTAAVVDPSGTVVLATDDGVLVGCIHVQRSGADAHFGMFAVEPTLQATGTGSALLAAAEEQARAWGCTTMDLEVVAQRSELIAWYERRGYARTGETKPFPYGDERFGIPQRDDLSFVVLRRGL